MLDRERFPHDRQPRALRGHQPPVSLEQLANQIVSGQVGWPNPEAFDAADRELLVTLVRQGLRDRLIRIIARSIARDLHGRRREIDTTEGELHQ